VATSGIRAPDLVLQSVLAALTLTVLAGSWWLGYAH
jgi:hypothetical protein